jgi:glycosyltransferase involved in cell wall biosynthesis
MNADWQERSALVPGKYMKILLSSYAFYPSMGGVEAFSAMLAGEFSLRGHEVIVVTDTVGESDARQYAVVRRPSKLKLFELVRWCDVYLQNNISLNLAWPLLFCRRPWAIINNGMLIQHNLVGRLKLFCARYATTSGVGEDAARNIGSKTVISSCYNSDLFQELPHEIRDRELVFLGRLVSEKGADVLVRALHQLKLEGMTPGLTIIGGGPEEGALRNLVSSLNLSEQVTFAGVVRDAALVRELNRHKILVAPSICREGFGLVALEAIACGCVVVGSEDGGLREAIGPCGVTFPNGDAAALAACLKPLLLNKDRIHALRKPASEHVARFTKENVADAYLRVLLGLCQGAE